MHPLYALPSQTICALHAALALLEPTQVPLAQLTPILFVMPVLPVWLGAHISLAPAQHWLTLSVHHAQPAQLAAHTSHLLAPPQPILSALPVQPVLLATMLVLLAHPL